MPLMADRNRIPDPFGARASAPAIKILESLKAPPQSIRIGLVNNMPDSALHDTESQFLELLAAAAGDLPVHVSFYSLPEVPRGERGMRHITNFYRHIDELWDSRVDAIIVTGTEPHQADLRQEPYWNQLTALFDWAEGNTKSTILSCLAAHAGVLHSDGIGRHPLTEKQCGVFAQSIATSHTLTQGINGAVCFPHSRWNEVREDELASHGYSILTKSPEAGVDLFVKKKRRSLFVHFQGHPEYGARTLLKEYRRDVGRFLRKERDKYPSAPRNYFDAGSLNLIAEFQQRAHSNQDGDVFSSFPDDELGRALKQSWRPFAVGIYSNWLQYVAARKLEATRVAAVGASGYRARPY
jgi:homoserine O-succinyltransferase/O-acetyltransferase